MNLFLEDTEVADKAKQAIKIKIALGDEGMRRVLASGLTDAEVKDPKKIYDLIERQLDASIEINFRVHRLEFSRMHQGPTENTTDFVSRLREKAAKCKLPIEELSERIIEQVILSTPHVDLRKALLTTDEGFAVSDVIKMARQHEAILASQASLQNLNIGTTEPMNVDAIYKGAGRSKCRNCGRTHNPKQCPAYRDTCDSCGRNGHWKAFCRQKRDVPAHTQRLQSPKRSQGRRDNKHSHQQDEVKVSDDYDSYAQSFSSINICGVTLGDGEAFTILDIKPPGLKEGSYTLKMKIDSGANGNTLPMRIFEKLYPSQTNRRNVLKTEASTKLTAYNGQEIPCMGYMQMPCKRGKQMTWHSTRFYVVDVPGPAVVGLPTSTLLQLLTLSVDAMIENQSPSPAMPSTIRSVTDLQRLYPEQFDRIGDFEGPATIRMKENAVPYIDAPRKFSVNLADSLKNELQSMVEQGVIRRVEEHTDWCSSLVVTTKPGGALRLCLDPKHLNESLKRCPHKIPTVEELNPKFTGAKFFSKLDAKAGYWAVHLDEESQLLTTFRSPTGGRYCWKRLPFGLAVSQDIFQARMDMILEGLPGIISIADDICCLGATESEHDENLTRLMRRAAKKGLVFNSAKCQIKRDQIAFFGNVYTADGIRPDPKKVESIKEMPTPQSKEDVQRFLGMVTYLSPFLPKLAAQSHTLRGLMKEDTPWIWDPSYEKAYQAIKDAVSDAACVKYYNTSEPISLEVDASQKGLGAVLVQSNGPVAYASKAITPTQSRYSNIERECLAVTFGILRYHHYLYGRRFTVVTDHKPLEVIFKKPLHSAPPRLQRMILKTHGYDFEVLYRPGKQMVLADALSRMPTLTDDTDIRLDDIQIDMMNFSATKQQDIREHTLDDHVLSKLAQIIHEGWPETRQQLPIELRDFWSYREQLGLQDGIIFKGRQVLIPRPVQNDILMQLHDGHQGIDKTRRLARESVFWPRINSDIEKLCTSCKWCQELQPQQAKEPMIMHEKPPGPWRKLGTDLFEITGRHFLIISDYYSRFPVVREMQKTTAAAIIDVTKQTLAMLGVPTEIMSDNGPQFLSEYDSFCEKWGVLHSTSSPRYPQSNGFIERQIKYIKPIIKKCIRSGGDIELALLNLRATPLDSVMPSPAELMFGRAIPTALPSRSTKVTHEGYQQHLTDRSIAQKGYADANTRPLRPLLVGEPTRVLNKEKKEWYPATVLEKHSERSYLLRTDGGRVIRRNRRQLAPIPDPDQPEVQQPTMTSQEQPTPQEIGPQHEQEPHVLEMDPDPDQQERVVQYETRSGRRVKRPGKYL